MNDLLQASIGLIGVMIGGFISYIAQTKHQQKIEERKDKRHKLIAYNNFLLLDGEKTPLVIPMHQGEPGGFKWNVYIEGTRKTLYENLHLFDKKIIEDVLQIDYIGERAEVMGPEPEDTDEIYDLYTEIRKTIEEDYKKNIKT